MSNFLTKFRELLPLKAKATAQPDGGGCGTGEGQYRPAWGVGEWGHWFGLDALDGTGYYRNLSTSAGRTCAAAFAAMNVIAQAVATTPMRHIRHLDNGGEEFIKTSALSRLLRNPNSYQTRSDFMLNLTFNLLAHGNTYGLAFRNNRQEVDSIHLMPPRSAVPYIEPDTKSIYYGIGDNPLIETPTILVPQRDVLHIRMHTPRHPLIGVSPIEHAAMAIAINTSITGNQASFFGNMSRPSGVISTDKELTKDQMQTLSEAWKAKSQGLNAGEVPILAWGLKWQPMVMTSQDAQLIEAYRMSIEDIARVFRVPLALIGDYQKMTYNNTEQLISTWLATGLGFIFEHIETALAKFIGLPADETVQFQADALLRTDFAGRIDGLTKAIQGGLYSPNEARAREGLPAMAYGDEPRVQAQVVPLSQIGAVSAITPETAPAAGGASPEPATEDEPEAPEQDKQWANFLFEQAMKKAYSA